MFILRRKTKNGTLKVKETENDRRFEREAATEKAYAIFQPLMRTSTLAAPLYMSMAGL